MSTFSAGLHALETTVLSWLGHLPPEGQAAVTDALKQAQSAASASITVSSTSLDPIWLDLERAIEGVMNTAELALLGPTVGTVAVGLSDAAFEAISAKSKASIDAYLVNRQAAHAAAK
jgi:hypothetical protein